MFEDNTKSVTMISEFARVERPGKLMCWRRNIQVVFFDDLGNERNVIEGQFHLGKLPGQKNKDPLIPIPLLA